MLLFVTFSLSPHAQNKVGDHPTAIQDGSLLELESLTKGVRLPRIPLNDVTKWTLDGVQASGMIIFNESGIEPKGIYYWSTDSSQWIRVVNKSELSTLIANYISQNTTVRDSLTNVINTSIASGTINGKDFSSNSAVLKVLNGSGVAIKAVQVDVDKNALGRLLIISPVSDSLSVAISTNTVIRDSIRSVVNNTITTGDLKGKDFSSNSAVLKVLNGSGATIKAVQIELDKNELGHLLNTTPLADSLSVAISNSTVIRDSIQSVVNNTITTGGMTGKDVTSNSAVLKVLNGSGAAIKAVQVDLDKNELGHLLNSTPLADSLSVAISNSTVIRDSIKSVVNNTINTGGMTGKDVTSNSAVLKVLNGSGAAIKAIQVDLDKNELGHLLNTTPLADSLSVAISNSTVIRDSITSVLKAKTTNTLAGSSEKLTSTVNGISAEFVPASGVVAKTLGFDAAGSLVSQLVAADASFNTNRIITLGGTSVTGQNLGAGGKTMAQFFEAFFFPAVAATPPTNTFTTATTVFPYSTWKNWGNPPSGTVSFTWGVTNLSLTDNTDDKAITSIKLKSGATELATVTPTGGNQSGAFSAIPFANTVLDPKTTFNKTFTLEVIDAQPNTVLSNINLTMSAAIPLAYAAPTLTPATLVYEYDIANKNISLNWAVTPNEEAITNISVDGITTGSTSSTGTQAVVFKTIANGGSVSKTFPLIVTGSIYGTGTSKNSPAVGWDNRLYRGTITSSVPPSDGTFAFTDAQIKALSSENKLGGNWKATAGYDFVCGAGGQYVCFAYPDDTATPVVQYYDPSFSSWMTYSTSDITIINRANFMNQLGYSGTNYKVVFVNPQYFGQTVKIRIQ